MNYSEVNIMITIEIHNAEANAISEVGKMKVAMSKAVGGNIQNIVETKMCNKIMHSLAENGVNVTVRVVNTNEEPHQI